METKWNRHKRKVRRILTAMQRLHPDVAGHLEAAEQANDMATACEVQKLEDLIDEIDRLLGEVHDLCDAHCGG